MSLDKFLARIENPKLKQIAEAVNLSLVDICTHKPDIKENGVYPQLQYAIRPGSQLLSFGFLIYDSKCQTLSLDVNNNGYKDNGTDTVFFWSEQGDQITMRSYDFVGGCEPMNEKKILLGSARENLTPRETVALTTALVMPLAIYARR